MNVDFDFKCLKFHLKFIRKTTTTGSVPLKRVNKSMNRSMNLGNLPHAPCILGKITRCCANLFQDFPFLLHQFVLHCSFQKLNAGSIVAPPNSDAILVAINKRINTNSNEASWLANGKPCRCYYTCDHMIFMKWIISLNNMTVM